MPASVLGALSTEKKRGTFGPGGSELGGIGGFGGFGAGNKRPFSRAGSLDRGEPNTNRRRASDMGRGFGGGSLRGSSAATTTTTTTPQLSPFDRLAHRANAKPLQQRPSTAQSVFSSSSPTAKEEVVTSTTGNTKGAGESGSVWSLRGQKQDGLRDKKYIHGVVQGAPPRTATPTGTLLGRPRSRSGSVESLASGCDHHHRDERPATAGGGSHIRSPLVKFGHRIATASCQSLPTLNQSSAQPQPFDYP
jgi:hypothetical protein